MLFPELSRSDLLFETKGSWYKAGRSQGVYLIDRHDPALKALYAATDRYAEKVNPYFDRSRLTFVCTIKADAALVSDAIRNVTVVGLKATPIAVLFTDDADREKRFFLDLDAERNPAREFAGESELATIEGLTLDESNSPADVMRTYVDAIKRVDMDTWRACYADWKVRATFQDDGQHLYVDRTWITINDRDAVSLWDKSRQRLLEDVYDIEVARVSEPRVVYDASQQPARLHDDDDPEIVEEVQILVDHVTRREETSDSDWEYLTFASATLKRKWTLQRLDDGPWRIVSAQGI